MLRTFVSAINNPTNVQPVEISIVQTEKYKAQREFFSFFLTALLGASVNFFSQIYYRDFFGFWFAFTGSQRQNAAYEKEGNRFFHHIDCWRL